MRVWYDQEVDILYISLGSGPAVDSEELDQDVRVEYGEEGKIIGIEVMNARSNLFGVVANEIAGKLREAMVVKR